MPGSHYGCWHIVNHNKTATDAWCMTGALEAFDLWLHRSLQVIAFHWKRCTRPLKSLMSLVARARFFWTVDVTFIDVRYSSRHSHLRFSRLRCCMKLQMTEVIMVASKVVDDSVRLVQALIPSGDSAQLCVDSALMLLNIKYLYHQLCIDSCGVLRGPATVWSTCCMSVTSMTYKLYPSRTDWQ